MAVSYYISGNRWYPVDTGRLPSQARATDMNGLANISASIGDRRKLPLLYAPGRVIPPSPMRRVVSLVSLSRRLPDEFIAQTLAEALCRESSRSVLLVQFVQSDGSLSLHDWRTLYPALNGDF